MDPDKHDDRSDGCGKEHPEAGGAPTIAVSVVGTVAMVMMVAAPAAISVHGFLPVQAMHLSDVYMLTLPAPGSPRLAVLLASASGLVAGLELLSFASTHKDVLLGEPCSAAAPSGSSLPWQLPSRN